MDTKILSALIGCTIAWVFLMFCVGLYTTGTWLYYYLQPEQEPVKELKYERRAIYVYGKDKPLEEGIPCIQTLEYRHN